MKRRAESLLEQVQRLLQRTYHIESTVGDVGRFVIGDRGYRRLYADRQIIRSVGPHVEQGACTLVRQADGEVRVSVYFPDAMIRRLEDYPPGSGLGDVNVDAFATLVEELDHLLCIADGVARGRTLKLFELELHANVSKHLVLALFAAGRRRRLDEERRAWLRYHLFDKQQFDAEAGATRGRYEDAARWAVQFLESLAGLEVPARLHALRGFHRADATDKLRVIRRLAA